MNEQKESKQIIIERKFEKRLTTIAGVWEIIMGLLTIFFYGPYHRRQGLDLIEDGIPLLEAEAINAVFSSLYMFIVILGMFFMILGLINVFLAKKMCHDQVERKIPIFLILIGIVSYFLMDFIGAILLLAAGTFALAKNKSIIKNKNEGRDLNA